MSKTLIGKVVSLKMPKTATIEVELSRAHPLYRKMVKSVKSYKAHNEEFELKLGDQVKIKEVRPISKDKHFRVAEVVGKAS